MVLEYFSLKKADQKTKPPVQVKERETPRSPVLTEEEERFWREVTEESTPPPLPDRPQKSKDAQIALMDGAEQVALPTSPPAEEEKKKNRFSAFYETTLARGNSVLSKRKEKGDSKEKEKDDKKEAKSKDKKGKQKETQAVPAVVEPAADVEKENSDLNAVLDQLNLAAVNNRVFSFSKESQELLDKFKIILKDIVNGVPTAYDDLEKLLRGSEEQLNKLYEGLPPWIQSLVRSLPAKMTAALGPEVLAAAAEKPSLSASATGASKSKKKRQIPSLKSLVTAQGAVATMLRSILNFLKLRFPMFMTGTNMLLSLAVFILLFVFWYCHKRGRETRLETEQRESKERAESAANSSDSDADDSIVLTPTNYYEESLKKQAEEQRAASNATSSEPPLTIHDDRVDQRPVSPRVENLPSVLDLPEPKEVPLPSATPGEKKN
ncbi:hypothetical protein EJ05DRAFT_536107 [Pseudovirgaria hyperparasitica]|uniref:Uncharacterized protein n=1 Tax=Pseudovirgaria hyperparasitica TaxID=470096 RepID=A0A6A6WGH2_9PEZI|nr:uncharacterized protein EJ05DRAFT_536107 [Pseudovirgaria hyperparasitica]KAF2761309.1 hypothetical protein EJ05DRAFT_536107 [Pseudovirgaria hyperparasitica]